MRINLKDIEENVSSISDRGSIEFVYQLLLAYGKPNSSITRLKKGDYNLAKDKTIEIYWKSNLYFRYVEHDDLHSTIDDLKGDPFVHRHSPRFIVVTDYKQLLAIDTKTEETLDIPIDEIASHCVFFLPWAGMEKSQQKTENLADVKAAERMAKLYDEITKHNESTDPKFIHALNVFFSRLLFCFFAEDTEVFDKGQFTNSIVSYTQPDGSDLSEYLDVLFEVLDIKEKTGYPSHLKAFPYVNGGLFSKKFPAPKFSKQARKLIIECGELDWAQINPDIFGSMIQAVVHPGQRAGLGMHYTSVVNIMKVIEPLFLEELLEEYDKAGNDEKKLGKLLHRIYSIKVFDPACGSGNFLIIAFKELRRLEHKILEILLENKLANIKISSGLKLENFYGIEIDDFAHEVAILSLWLAKHQMNIEFKKKFGKDIPLIPLKDTGNITHGNSLLEDWNKICPKDDQDELYIISNPPFLGARNPDFTKEQKEDLIYSSGIRKVSGVNSLDYVAGWFFKASDYIADSQSKCALIATNSICQGAHISMLWPHILSSKIEIIFAHKSFKWSNSAKNGAKVTCVVVGLGKVSTKKKKLFDNETWSLVDKISPHLTATEDSMIPKRSKPISNIQPLVFGNQAIDGGHLIISTSERDEILRVSPNAKKFIRRLYGADDFINNSIRWCIWVSEMELPEAEAIPAFVDRFSKVRSYRATGGQVARSLTKIPYRFRYIHEAKASILVLPRTTSERRSYLPIGILDNSAIVTDAAQVIYDPETYIFGLLSSRIHMVWVKSTAGRLKSDLRYSNSICYNNFPVPLLTDKQKQMINNNVFEILDIRERYSERTLGQLYDPDKMPSDLRAAHRGLDEVVELCYRPRPFESDQERLAYLFKLYETMTTVQKELI